MTFLDMFRPSVLTNEGSMCFAWCYGVLVVDGLGLWLFLSLRPVLFTFFFLVSTLESTLRLVTMKRYVFQVICLQLPPPC